MKRARVSSPHEQAKISCETKMSPVSIELSQLERVGKKQTDSLRTHLHRLKVLCSWARLLTRAEPLSTQQYCCDGLAFHAGEEQHS